MVINIPHLRERTYTVNTTGSATSVLTVDNIESSDKGVYHCMAVDGNNAVQGDAIDLRGMLIV